MHIVQAKLGHLTVGEIYITTPSSRWRIYCNAPLEMVSDEMFQSWSLISSSRVLMGAQLTGTITVERSQS